MQADTVSLHLFLSRALAPPSVAVRAGTRAQESLHAFKGDSWVSSYLPHLLGDTRALRP